MEELNKKQEIEKMVKEYKIEKLKPTKSLKNEIDNKTKEIEEQRIEAKKIELHLERLEDNYKEDKNTYKVQEIKEYDNKIEEVKNEKSAIEKSIEEIENELKKLKENDSSIKDKPNKELDSEHLKRMTQEKISIEKDILMVDAQIQLKVAEVTNFKHEYDEDTNTVLNGQDYKETVDKLNNLKDEKNVLIAAKELCENEINVVKKQFEKNVENLNEIISRKNKVQPKPQPQPVPKPQPEHVEGRLKIDIDEKSGTVFVRDVNKLGLDIELSKNQINEFKKTKEYKDMINETVNGTAHTFWGKFMLKRKLDPGIVMAINTREEDSVSLMRNYVYSMYQNKFSNGFEFDIQRDLSGLNFPERIFNTIKNGVKYRTEEHSGMQLIGKLFNKNKTLPSGEEQKAQEENKPDKKIKNKTKTPNRFKSREDSILTESKSELRRYTPDTKKSMSEKINEVKGFMGKTKNAFKDGIKGFKSAYDSNEVREQETETETKPEIKIEDKGR